MSKVVNVPLDLIDVVEEVPVLSPNPGQVAFFADLIESGEDLQPIFVYPKDNRYILVDGINRLEAHRLIGLKTIKAILVDLVDIAPEEVIFLPDIYPRSQVNQDRVEFFAELMRHGQKFPLIFTTKVDEGFVLLDGKYRLDAYYKAGISKIKICVLDNPEEPWLLTYTAFNVYGSTPYTTEEINSLIIRGFRRGFSPQEIARELQYPLSYVESTIARNA